MLIFTLTAFLFLGWGKIRKRDKNGLKRENTKKLKIWN